MSAPAIGHPAADRATAEALVVEQNRAVVPLSGWVADAAVAAVRSGRLLQVLTLPDSAITYPLELMLADVGGQWVVRDRTGFRDGFTGAPLDWTGTRFAPSDGSLPEVAAVDLRCGGLELQVTTLHPADDGLELGATAAAAIRALTGADPAGWGTAEPVTQPWSRRELTGVCRERAPDPTALVVVGGAGDRLALGRLFVARVNAGVLEELRLSGPSVTAVAEAELDVLAGVLAGLAPAPRSMVVRVHPVRLAGLRPSLPAPPALPYALLVGPAQVVRRGTEHARLAPAADIRLVGGTSPACWCRFPGEAAYAQLTAVLEHFRSQ